MIHLVIFIVLSIVGYILGLLSGFNPIEHSTFSLFASAVLTLGLYTSVSGIDISSLGKYRNVALFVIILGVPLKILLIGAIMWLISPSPLSFVIAVTVAQIDPLSVATLLDNKTGMSRQAKTLLNIWASFDDPVTVLIGFTLLAPIVTGQIGTSIASYIVSLSANILPAVILYLITKKFKLSKTIEIMILLVTLPLAIVSGSFLFAALLGLFVRPLKPELLLKVTTWIYYLVILIVGMSMNFYNIDLRIGIILGIITFFVVQPLISVLIIKGTLHDIFRLSYAQQNGITAILMALAFQSIGLDVVGIILPAVVTINFCNIALNNYYTWKEKLGHIQEHVN